MSDNDKLNQELQEVERIRKEKLRTLEKPLVATPPKPRSFEGSVGDLAKKISAMQFRDNGVYAQREQERKEREEREHRAMVARLRLHWNAPDRCVKFHESAVIDYSSLTPWNKALNYARERIGSSFMIALIGGRGTGKTQLATELMYDFTDLSKPALYTTCLRFLMEVRATYRKDSKESEIDVIERYRKPHLLVLDEFGKRGATEWEFNMLFQLLDNRYQDLTSTLILSNETKAQFDEAAGDSVNRRINQTGGIIDTTTWPKLGIQPKVM